MHPIANVVPVHPVRSSGGLWQWAALAAPPGGHGTPCSGSSRRGAERCPNVSPLLTDARLLLLQGGLINFEKRRKVRVCTAGWWKEAGVVRAQALPLFGGRFWSFLGVLVHGAGLFAEGCGAADRGGLTASIGCRSLKSSPRSSCFSQPATTTASLRRTILWTGSTVWSGSVRLRGECKQGCAAAHALGSCREH